MLICGIDEAGRGPVIGPLVMAGVMIEETEEQKLKEIGCKDSKLLTREEREDLFKKIISMAKDYKIISITSDKIDEAVKLSNLNILEAHTTSQILNELKPSKAFIDLPDSSAERYQYYIRDKLSDEAKAIELVTEHKADFNYPCVSAASILAKVTRDRYIDFLKEKFGEDFGSGYMSDEKTQKFLEKHWNNPHINFFRKEWQSWKDAKAKKEQKKLFDF